MINVEIWGSGKGSNARNIIHYFADHPHINITALTTNSSRSSLQDIGEEFNIPVHTYLKNDWNPDKVLAELVERKTDYIVLAGFLKLVPEEIIQAFEARMINVHPSLLPKYGGKGMYGDNVHAAVVEAKEKLSGITLHEVNAEFDKGKVLAQFSTPVEGAIDSLKQNIAELEMQWFPRTIEAWILSNRLS